VLGYNGMGRLTGDETGSVGGGGGDGAGGMWGATGWGRMFNSEIGGQVAWLLPAALILLVAGLVVTRRRYRTDRTRAAVLLWGGWLLVTGLTFSFMAGIFHAYYTVALAPAIGALVGIGVTELWRRRSGTVVLAITLAVTAAWSYVLLRRSADFLPALAPVLLAAGLIVAIGLLLVRVLPRRTAAVLAGAGLIVALAGPAAYAVDTAATPHTGSIPSAGPTVAGGMGGPGGRGGGFRGGQAPRAQTGQGQTGQGPTGQGPTGQGQTGQSPTGQGPTGPGGGGGMSGLLNGSTASTEMVQLLQADAGDYTWAAATVGSNNASGYQLASGEPVMAIGGFNGTDPSPTLAEFQQYVAAGKIHYFLSGGTGGGAGTGGSAAAQEIVNWVAQNYTASTVDNTTVYDLSG
jgi:4-amino-4-deoxy-L-arabinose transferase-like glycosyltransferase